MSDGVRPMWSVEISEDVAVVTALGAKAQCDSCASCCDCWALELAAHCRTLTAGVVVLDLSRIDVPSYRMLDVAHREYRAAERRGAVCRVCVASNMRELFALTKLDRLIRAYPDRASALADADVG